MSAPTSSPAPRLTPPLPGRATPARRPISPVSRTPQQDHRAAERARRTRSPLPPGHAQSQPTTDAAPPTTDGGREGRTMVRGPRKVGSRANVGAERTGDHPLSKENLEKRGYHSFLALGRPFHVEKRWKLVRELGQGAYGHVVAVRDDFTGVEVAVKVVTRIFDKTVLARRALREIALLRHFNYHENITGLIDMDILTEDYNEIYLFLEPMEADLHQIIRSGQPISNAHCQYFIYQVFRGVKYIHSANVIHRDLKPGNLLVNSDCELKICDFGLARGFEPARSDAEQAGMTEYVATRWYRAPEVMLSFRNYGTAIDMWSIGCILAELLSGKPLFKGKDYIEQINLIFERLGTPSEEDLEMCSEKARAYIHSLPIYTPIRFEKSFPDADPLALDLLSRLLTFNPARRITVQEAIQHPWIAAFHDPGDEPECAAVFDKFDLVEREMDIDEFREVVRREVSEFRREVRDEFESPPPEDEQAGFEEQQVEDAQPPSLPTSPTAPPPQPLAEAGQIDIPSPTIAPSHLRRNSSYSGSWHAAVRGFTQPAHSRTQSPASSAAASPSGAPRRSSSIPDGGIAHAWPPVQGQPEAGFVRPRNRTNSASGDALRPLMRQLSTVSIRDGLTGVFAPLAPTKVDSPTQLPTHHPAAPQAVRRAGPNGNGDGAGQFGPLTLSNDSEEISEPPLEFGTKRSRPQQQPPVASAA